MANIWLVRTIWEERAAEELKALLRDAGMSYAQLAEALNTEGVSAGSLTKKLYRGAFTHAFFLECREVVRRQSENGVVRPGRS